MIWPLVRRYTFPCRVHTSYRAIPHQTGRRPDNLSWLSCPARSLKAKGQTPDISSSALTICSWPASFLWLYTYADLPKRQNQRLHSQSCSVAQAGYTFLYPNDPNASPPCPLCLDLHPGANSYMWWEFFIQMQIILQDQNSFAMDCRGQPLRKFAFWLLI